MRKKINFINLWKIFIISANYNQNRLPNDWIISLLATEFLY